MKNIRTLLSVALLGSAALWAQTPTSPTPSDATTDSSQAQPQFRRLRQRLEASQGERPNADSANKAQAQAQPVLRQEAADELRVAYFKGIRDYIQRYAMTPASCSEIVDAALSANKELGEKFMKAMVGSKPTTSAEASQSIDSFRRETRLWAMQMALEAKYPDPSLYKAKVEAKGAKH